MVNTRTDADLSVAVQNALQTLLPQIRAEIREEFRTSFGPSEAGKNPPPVTIHTWLERFNKQKPYSFKKATAPERLKREYHSIRQTNTETSMEFMQCFLRLAGFLGAAVGTEEEQAKNFQWGLRMSPSHVYVVYGCGSGRRVVIGISRPLSRVVTGTTVIITTVMGQTGEVVVTTIATTTTTLAVTTGSSGLRRFFGYAMFIYSLYLCYSLSLYPFTECYAQPYFFSCLIRQTFKTLCLLNYALMIRHDYDITSSLRRGALQQ
nr:zinc finger, CCHC-type, retrotransposon Gag domain protein [Tanacetum cinerariifolium]